MSKTKYFIYGGGRWREVDENGRVAGWAGSRFIYVKRGKLSLAKRKTVVRGLQRLADGRPTTVQVGLPLSQIKNKDLHSKDVEHKNLHGGCHCCGHKTIACCDTDANFNKLLKPLAHSVAIQFNATKDIGTQVVPYTKKSQNSLEKPSDIINEPAIHTEARKDDSIRNTQRFNKQNYCKDLVIDASGIELFRTFIENDTKNIFNVDLLLFDENDNYKKHVFYKINPIVKVERNRQIQCILDQNNETRQKEFVQILGLQSVNDPTLNRKYSKRKRAFEDKKNYTNKLRKLESVSVKEKYSETVQKSSSLTKHSENVKSGGSDVMKKVTENLGDRSDGKINVVRKAKNGLYGVKKICIESGSSKSNKKPVKKMISNRSKKQGRDYSSLEDDAIVTWILKNDKANFVNGNRVWRILQPIHHANTGQFRSWHSLRNRYLRYILPSLGSMSLPYSQISSLRAAASAGEIKGHKAERRNSIFKTSRVRSAWTARPKERGQNKEKTPTPRPLRSNTTISPPENKLPTYAEITRRFAMRHRSTPNSIESDRQLNKNREVDRPVQKTDKAQPTENKTVKQRIKQRIAIDDDNSESEAFQKRRNIVRHSRQTRDKRRISKRLDKLDSSDQDVDKEPTTRPRRENEKKDKRSDGTKTINTKSNVDINKNKQKYDNAANAVDSEADKQPSTGVWKVLERTVKGRFLKLGKSHKRDVSRSGNDLQNNISLGNIDEIKSGKRIRPQHEIIGQSYSDAEERNKKTERSTRQSNQADKHKSVDRHSSRSRKTDRHHTQNKKADVTNEKDEISQRSDKTKDSSKQKRRSRYDQQKDRQKPKSKRQQKQNVSHNNEKPDSSRRTKEQTNRPDRTDNGEAILPGEEKSSKDDRQSDKQTDRQTHKDKKPASRTGQSDRENRPSKEKSTDRNNRSSSCSDVELIHPKIARQASGERNVRQKETTDQKQCALSTDSGRQSKREAEEIDRQAKKPRTDYKIDISDDDIDDFKEHLIIKNKQNLTNSSSSNLSKHKGQSSYLRLKFEEDLTNSSSFIDSDSSSSRFGQPIDRQTRSAKIALVENKNNTDRQKRTRRLFNPNVPM